MMSKNFVVAVDSSTKEQEEKFVGFLNSKGLGWWHWISNFWLITDSKSITSASELVDILIEILPGVNNFVFEVTQAAATWYGYGPAGPEINNNMFNWLRENWHE
jgi:hypothetical protein